jgi:C1A family cysteine protease
MVYEYFETMRAPFLYTPNKKDEQVLGGHEVLVIGYDDNESQGAFKVRNSWGKDWANGGNFWLPYSVAADPAILMDAWMSHLGRAW